MKYFLTDLDGTLLRSDATLSDYTINSLKKFLEEGVAVSFATARSYSSAIAVVHDVPWKYPMVLYNGAILYDPVENKIIDGFLLTAEEANEIIEIGKQFKLMPLLYVLDENDEEKVFHEELTTYGMVEFLKSRKGDPRYKLVDKLYCEKMHRALALTYIFQRETLKPLMKAVREKFGDKIHISLVKDTYIENQYFLEFGHANSDKKNGIKLWAAHMDCEVSEITVFGDNSNDVGMFETAGNSVAVSNAKKELLHLAKHVTVSNDEDGVVKYISDNYKL
ncbi:HAD family hydrolase [Clostridium sp. 19966]|uniref:HAD family hydrolase n=1 Tax=Clostridium sp. 19966 TaxID=2768166 RepID=UPI0028DDA939|nr:HAD family hydrolase [Clostridium sp. 19966]MDT8717597.1 HAD family hydrolase [Clostridium sp. 19966]